MAAAASATVERDIQRTIINYSSNVSEVAVKTAGFSESNFETVDGKVVIKKSVAEAIAKKLLGTDDIEVIPLPWFEAKFLMSDMNGKIADVRNSVLVKPLNVAHWFEIKGEELLFLSIISPEAGEFLEYAPMESEYDDSKFTIMPVSYVGLDEPVGLIAFIRDGGKYDLDKTENGSVVGQLVIVLKTESKEEPKEPINPTNPGDSSSSGCNAIYASIPLLLGFTLLVIKKNA